MTSIDVATAQHASRHATGGEDPITPESIGAAPEMTNVTFVSNADWNTIFEGGYYYDSTGNANAPYSNRNGYMEVVRLRDTDQSCMQRWTEYRGDIEDVEVWVRTCRGGTWSSWTLASLRDTGWRDISAGINSAAGWELASTGAIRVRCVGLTVFAYAYNVRGPSATSTTVVTLPLGFRPIRAHVPLSGYFGDTGVVGGRAMVPGDLNVDHTTSPTSYRAVAATFSVDSFPLKPYPGTPA